MAFKPPVDRHHLLQCIGQQNSHRAVLLWRLGASGDLLLPLGEQITLLFFIQALCRAPWISQFETLGPL